MSDIDIKDAAMIEGKITTRIWDADAIEHADPKWSNRSRQAKRAILNNPSRYPTAPMHEGVTSNIIVDNYLELLAQGENPQPTHLAIGDGTTAPEASNMELNNEVYRTIVGADETSGRDRITSTVLTQNEANGHALREIGLVTGQTDDDWELLTHAVLSDSDQVDEKQSNMIVTYNYTINWRRVN